MTSSMTTVEEQRTIALDEKFMAWIGELEKLMQAWGDKHCDGGTPYSLPLANSTGLSYWHDGYADGMTPQEAFDSDQSYWEE